MAPIVPHIAEEFWAYFGNKTSVHLAKWPEFKEEYTGVDTITLVIQVNGKTRDKLEVSASATKEECEKLALENERVQKFFEGQQVVKVIVVPQKLVNIVAK